MYVCMSLQGNQIPPPFPDKDFPSHQWLILLVHLVTFTFTLSHILGGAQLCNILRSLWQILHRSHWQDSVWVSTSTCPWGQNPKGMK